MFSININNAYRLFSLLLSFNAENGKKSADINVKCAVSTQITSVSCTTHRPTYIVRTYIHIHWSQVVQSVLTGWMAELRFPAEKILFSSLQRTDRLWGTPSLISNGYRSRFLGAKAAGAWSYHSPPSSSDMKKECINTSTIPYFCMLWCLISTTDNFTLTLTICRAYILKYAHTSMYIHICIYLSIQPSAYSLDASLLSELSNTLSCLRTWD
jgi:hypothetical protein